MTQTIQTVKDMMGKTVKVAMRGISETNVFTGKIVDYTTSNTLIVWVERLEDGEWVAVNLSNPNINTVEEIQEAVVTVESNDLKQLHKEIDRAFKYEDEDEIKLMIKVYDCFEGGEQSYDVEIQWAIGDDVYTDCVVTDSFYSTLEGDQNAKKQAVARAKSVLRTVKGWFKYSEIKVVEGVEVYHA